MKQCALFTGAKNPGIMSAAMIALHASTPPGTCEPVCIALSNVSKRYGRRRVLTDVSATIEQGTVLGVSGPNGSGKSTLLRILAGILVPDSGEARVTVSGRTLDRHERRAVIGWVAPEVGLYPSLTGAEHVELYAALRGIVLTSEEIREALAVFGLGRRLRDPVRSYSSGMRQRLRYVCATIHRPRILLLDEPFGNLDLAAIEAVRRLVEMHRDAGVTVVAGNDDRELDMADALIHLGSTASQ